jgi:serine/threonine-protein kinase
MSDTAAPFPSARLIELFDQALAQAPADREAWIDENCRGEPELAERLRALLAADSASAGLLDLSHHVIADELGLQIQAADVPSALDPHLHQCIGAWRIVAPLGRGGMGMVYRAERADGAFAQTVALKVIRDEKLSAQARARFVQERNILARLSHPNIAQLVDGGVDEKSEPWFAMEYIEGRSLIEWCDARGLRIEARLKLLLDVCGAVEFAHSRLVVHRDIKPSNVLVDEAGVTKLLDFGIAKLLDDQGDDALATETRMRLLTPEYAAPEQVRGDPITTATDIHALGLLLYELLCGQRAFGGKTRSTFDVQREVIEQDPPSLSARYARLLVSEPEQARQLAAQRGSSASELRQRLSGDLQCIVDKAVRKLPEQRYASVAALADDLRAYLRGDPVAAAGGARSYRAAKFLRKYRLAVALSSAALVCLIAGIVGVGIESHRANREAALARSEAQRAEAEARSATAVRDFLLDVFKSADPQNALGKIPNAIDLVDNGARRVDIELHGQPLLQQQLFDALGVIYADLGRYDTALATLRKGRAIAARENDSPQSIGPQLDLDFATVVATNIENLGSEEKQTLTDEAQRLLDRIVSQQQTLPAAQRHLLVKALIQRGNIESYRSDYAKAEATLRAAVEQARARGDAGESELASALYALGNEQDHVAHNKEAIAFYRESLGLRERLYDAKNPLVTEIALALGADLTIVGAYAEAEPLLRKAVDAHRATLGENDVRYALSLQSLAQTLMRQSKFDEAQALLQRSLTIINTHAGNTDSELAASILADLGILEHIRGNSAEAARYMRQSLAILQKYHGFESFGVRVQLNNLAAVDYDLGNYAQAEKEFRQLLEWQRKIDPNAVDPIYLGRIRRMLGHPEEALELHRASLQLAQKDQGGESSITFVIKGELGKEERDLGHLQQARTYMQDALRGYTDILKVPGNDSGLLGMRYLLAQIDYLEGHCASSLDTLQAQADAFKKQTEPAKHWRVAEAGLLIGLCQKQTKSVDPATRQALIRSSAAELIQTPAADPFFKRLAREALAAH